MVIANKMESNGKAGHIMISEDTKFLVENSYPNEFRFEKSGTVAINTYNKTIEAFFVYND